MPLRDHFHPPLTDRRSWNGLHGQWPAMIVIGLNRLLPEPYVAEPQIHLSTSVEVDVGTFEVRRAGLAGRIATLPTTLAEHLS